jgi:hypothetical protein
MKSTDRTQLRRKFSLILVCRLSKLQVISGENSGFCALSVNANTIELFSDAR